jgi:hypothetical protein
MAWLLVFAVSVCGGSRSWAQPAPAPTADLSNQQQQMFRDYERFEKALFDVAEQVRRKDPERAELLYRARSQSQEQNILSEMRTISELLRSQTSSGTESIPQLGPAADRQKELVVRLEAVLRVLQSLDERERVAAEIERIQQLLKETNRIIARQKDVRADTQRNSDLKKSADAQKKVAEEAQTLEDKIDQQDAERNSESPHEADSSSGKSQSPQKDRPEDQPDAKKPSPQTPSDSDGKPSESGKEKSGSPEDSKSPGNSSGKSKPEPGQPSESGKSGGEESSPGGDSSGDQKSGDKKSGDQKKQGQPPQPPGGKSPEDDSQKTAGREELEQARRAMEKAIEELEKNAKNQALDEQDEALNRLEELKAQLEEILRQLREDERESYLTLLEARFQNMLKRQQQVNQDTRRIDGIPAADRAKQNFASQADVLRKDQEDNALEAEKTSHLLKEEGSSVAFPEAVDQMLQNMNVVASRLSKQETGKTTQLVEQLIVETLEEMIAALRQELQKKQEQQQGGAGGQAGPPQDPSLVDQIAELKLIRSLQTQINRLTKQIGTELNGELPSDPGQMQLIRDLRVRQERIQKATYDLSVGRNQ